MTNIDRVKKPTIADLERRIAALEAQIANRPPLYVQLVPYQVPVYIPSVLAPGWPLAPYTYTMSGYASVQDGSTPPAYTVTATSS